MTTDTGSSDHVVDVRGLGRRFGRTDALMDLDLAIRPGCVLGLVGENGAGKTTLVRHLLGMLRAQSGTVRVFGLDPVLDPVGVLGRIGYLSEKRDIPLWMRVRELLRYTAAFHPGWDEGYAKRLVSDFGLDPDDRLRNLSNGQQARAALIAAVAHRPELLLLDEPSAGLDAAVRRDILGAIIRTVSDEGRTVLFSSHLLDEVERVSDSVAMIHKGRIVMSGPLDDVKQAHRRLTLRFPEARTTPPALPGAITCEGGGREWTVLCHGDLGALPDVVRDSGGAIVEEAVPSLEDIFVARVSGRRATTEEG